MNPSERRKAMAILDAAEHRLTAGAFIRELSRTFDVPQKSAKQMLRVLVENRDLTFQDLYGGSYVSQSFEKPVQITPHFYLSPPGMAPKAGPGQKEIVLHPGISFGSGHHATTRLCLSAIDHLFIDPGPYTPESGDLGADIGTGSGVLALAMCRSGLARCQAFDIDANAVSEARKNIAANGLARRITVSDTPLPDEGPAFSVICANLRFPTLKKLSPLMAARIIPGGFLIFSGIREWELSPLIAHYERVHFSLLWHQTDKNWAAALFREKEGP